MKRRKKCFIPIWYIGLHKENKFVYTTLYILGIQEYYRRNVFIPRTIGLLI